MISTTNKITAPCMSTGMAIKMQLELLRLNSISGSEGAILSSVAKLGKDIKMQLEFFRLHPED
ncbi:hypothetical protein PVAP13_3KG402000 [Panicum virgatum]|uniref:Uncharacterized protein n=1 Tax=Panicum virgatum TaxID=38727 RepID=A0A8T0V6C5_PANVG|nr:hypothetical protein PVAP13_3KG402000 [Panicum virgatum]